MSHRPSPVAERSEKASLGSNGLAARRSTVRVTTRAAIAATSRPTLPSGCAAMALSDMKAMARQISATRRPGTRGRSEEHTSELQSRLHLVCRLLLEKKKKNCHVGPGTDANQRVHTHN